MMGVTTEGPLGIPPLPPEVVVGTAKVSECEPETPLEEVVELCVVVVGTAKVPECESETPVEEVVELCLVVGIFGKLRGLDDEPTDNTFLL
jgi:hypothetical protein